MRTRLTIVGSSRVPVTVTGYEALVFDQASQESQVVCRAIESACLETEAEGAELEVGIIDNANYLILYCDFVCQGNLIQAVVCIAEVAELWIEVEFIRA